MFNHKCSICAEKDKEIAYLKTLVDNLLLHQGVAPVVSEAETVLEETEEEKLERANIEKGVLRYGD